MNHSAIHNHLQGILTTVINFRPIDCCKKQHRTTGSYAFLGCAEDCIWNKLQDTIAKAVMNAELYLVKQEVER